MNTITVKSKCSMCDHIIGLTIPTRTNDPIQDIKIASKALEVLITQHKHGWNDEAIDACENSMIRQFEGFQRRQNVKKSNG